MAADMSMPRAAIRLLLSRPKVMAPLDPNFSPVILGKRKYLAVAKDCKDIFHWALPRADGCGRGCLPVFPEKSEEADASVYLLGVLIQEMIWMRSGQSLMLCGPKTICERVKAMYSKGGMYQFEIESMPNVCGTPDAPFEVIIVDSVLDLPEPEDTPQVCGKVADGNRLAFDLGKSDIKTVVIKDGQVLDSKETEWDVTNPDPDYHYNCIKKAMLASIERAGSEFGPIQAVGGSATGTVSADNEATWCDIFPNVPRNVYKAKVVDIFKRLAADVSGRSDIPLKVINDGEVTALAASVKIGAGNVMGVSLGSSEGAGYADANGNLLGWINELCYVRLDLNPEAPTDAWSKGHHTGLSHMYLGQRGASKLAGKAGAKLKPELIYPHPDMTTIRHENHAQVLKLIQAQMMDPEMKPKLSKIYQTIGVYFGYALAQYTEFYKIDHVMILGRVSKGDGGNIMLSTAKKVLETEFPEIPPITFHEADENFKAVGQCIAAAALPAIGGDAFGGQEGERKKIVGGNWKSNPASIKIVTDLCRDFRGCTFDETKCDVVIFPTSLHGAIAQEELSTSAIEVGVQNISKTRSGAFTGEFTAAMAKECGFGYTLIGHSERRSVYGETDEDTAAKVEKALGAGLKVIFCIGETLEEREKGITDRVNQRQISAILPKVKNWTKVVIAYEPVWAIGTGKVATPEQAQETHSNIRKFLAEKLGQRKANAIRIQYGGSVTPENCVELISKPDIDGFLVGGASLKPTFTKIIEACSA